MLVSTLLRDRYKLDHGDMVRLRTGHGEHDFRVAGIVAMFYQGGQSFIISRKDVEKYWGDTAVMEVPSRLSVKPAFGPR